MNYPRIILFLAALYNIGWGAAVSLFPKLILFGECESVFMLIVLKCVGMLVGVYGIAYYFASLDPERYWPLILVGLIGKVLGPIGSLYYIYTGELDSGFFLTVNVFNDLIWIIPFSWILLEVYRGNLTKANFKNQK